ncbi:MAG: hydrolase [Wenzhouxiangellaceae bacterium]|nr:hydrolase [Wenzhouxiangellaceae bacterium]
MEPPHDTTATERARQDDSVLVVVDVQGRLARLMHESEAMIRQQQILISACRTLAIPVVWAEQLPDKLGDTVDELQTPLEGLEPCAKSSFGCWGDATLRGRIEETGRRQVLLCGIETHVCVWQTAAALIDAGYGVHVIADAVSSRSAFNRDIGFRRLERAGAHLSNVEMVLFELMVDATHERFREVTRLLK